MRQLHCEVAHSLRLSLRSKDVTGAAGLIDVWHIRGSPREDTVICGLSRFLVHVAAMTFLRYSGRYASTAVQNVVMCDAYVMDCSLSMFC